MSSHCGRPAEQRSIGDEAGAEGPRVLPCQESLPINPSCMMVSYVFPRAALEVRAKMIKRMGVPLALLPGLAQEGFGLFRENYGLQQALPILGACRPEYIFRIMKREKFIISLRDAKHLVLQASPRGSAAGHRRYRL